MSILDVFHKPVVVPGASPEVKDDPVYAVFDAKANMHYEPFRAGNDAVAVRGFSDSVNNPQSNLSKHPEDYSLWRLGSFNSVSGRFTNLERAINLCSASSLLGVQSKG